MICKLRFFLNGTGSNVKALLALSFSLMFFSSVIFSSCKKTENAENQNAEKSKALVIWAYDSFVSEWGPAASVAEAFTRKTGIDIKWESAGDAGELLSRLLLEGAGASADLIIGLDGNLAPRALSSNLFEPYKPKTIQNLLGEFDLKDDFRLIPYDYGYFAFIYDSEKIPVPPKNLEELTLPQYKNKIILMDPRTSSVGLGFLHWITEVYGPNWEDYWRRLRPSLLTVSAGWSEGYGLFTTGEAPLVISYTTSPAYHVEYEETNRYKAALFEEGHPKQVEYAGMLVYSKNKEAAKLFIDFMLTSDFQKEIPLTNWMYPVIEIELPASYSAAPKAERSIEGGAVSEADIDRWAEAQ